jgi:hypothetical protein
LAAMERAVRVQVNLARDARSGELNTQPLPCPRCNADNKDYVK